jgi:hypothetical protein
MIHSVLKNPDYSSHEKKEGTCDEPHLDSKWLEERPRARLLFLDWSNYNQP